MTTKYNQHILFIETENPSKIFQTLKQKTFQLCKVKYDTLYVESLNTPLKLNLNFVRSIVKM